MAATNSIAQTLPQAVPGTDIHDIRPPVVIPGWEWLIWVFAGLFVLGLIVWAVVYFVTKRRNTPPPPLPPAHVRARQKLEEALALIAQPKPFCIMVSDTIRQYLEERFNFRAPERTTEEFLYELRKSHLLTSNQKETLGGFLQQCDLVKFAKYEPAETELRGLHDSALRLVEETEPLPEGAVMPAPVVARPTQPEPLIEAKS